MADFLKFLWQQLRPHRRTIIVCSILAILAAGLDTAAPALMGRSFDLAKGQASFLWYDGALLAWFLLRLVSERLRAHIARRGDRVGTAVRERIVVEAILNMLDKPLAFHNGELGSALTEKLDRLKWAIFNVVSGIVFDLVPALLATAGIVIYLAFQNWQLALILTIGVIFHLVYSYRQVPRILAANEHLLEVERQTSTTGWDALHNVLIVKSTANETALRQTVEQQNREYLKADDEYGRLDISIINRQNLVVGVTSLAVMSVAVHALAAGSLSFGQVTAITAYIFQIFGYLRWAQWQFRQVPTAVAGYKTMRATLETPAEDFTSGESAELGGAVEFRHVRFRYQEERPALEDVSFRVESGERVAIVGESGEGKTTLVNLLGRYYLPQGGEILFDGRPSGNIRLDSLRSQMAYVPQDLSLFHESIAFNIRYGRLGATDEEVLEAARQAHLAEFIENLPAKYDTIVGERGLKLSGGERQRVAIARAFLRNPKILVLDEPTSNLDAKTENFIQESLGRLMRGRTTFIIAHRLRTVAGTDKILVLKDGRIAESGSPGELAERPGGAYRAMLQAQGALGGGDIKLLDDSQTAA